MSGAPLSWLCGASQHRSLFSHKHLFWTLRKASHGPLICLLLLQWAALKEAKRTWKLPPFLSDVNFYHVNEHKQKKISVQLSGQFSQQSTPQLLSEMQKDPQGKRKVNPQNQANCHSRPRFYFSSTFNRGLVNRGPKCRAWKVDIIQIGPDMKVEWNAHLLHFQHHPVYKIIEHSTKVWRFAMMMTNDCSSGLASTHISISSVWYYMCAFQEDVLRKWCLAASYSRLFFLVLFCNTVQAWEELWVCLCLLLSQITV